MIKCGNMTGKKDLGVIVTCVSLEVLESKDILDTGYKIHCSNTIPIVVPFQRKPSKSINADPQ